MKKILTLILGMMIVASCDLMPKSSSENSNCNLSELEEMDFETEELNYSFEEGKIEVSIKVDYPTDGNPLLVNAVREFISEELGGTYADNLEEGQQLVDFYGDILQKQLQKSYQEDVEANDGNEENINGFYRHYAINKNYESDHFITYIVESGIYLNGAHGTESHYGLTFRKSDGRRLCNEMMRNLYTEDFYAIIKKGLMEYFSEGSNERVNSDEELKSFIITDDDVNYLPLPRHTPYITKEGFVFTYQPYEISFYAAGMPQFTIRADKMKPFLTQTALNMLDLD